MKNSTSFAMAAALAFLALCWAGSARAEDEKNAEPEKPNLSLSSKEMRMTVGACVHIDYAAFDEDERNIPGVGSQESDVMAKRVRLFLRGNFDDGIGFYIQAGYELNTIAFLDAIIMMPVGSDLELRFGQMKTPFSQEKLRAWSSQPFIERSLAANLDLRRSQGAEMIYTPGQGPLQLTLGCFTGESMAVPSTDDHFEYYGRAVFRPDKAIGSFPGQSSFGAAYARGRRIPERNTTASFGGKTLNGLAFFVPVPVNGYRTRYEFDADYRVGPVFFAGEYIHSEEEREGVNVNLDTNGDGAGDLSFKGHLDPLVAEGWYAAFVWVVTGEDYTEVITPNSRYGALELAVRYSTISYDTQGKINAGGGVTGVEANAASTALGRPSVEESVNETYIGLNWIVRRGVFFEFAYLMQDFEDSSPSLDGDTNDVNYRARVGLLF